MLVAPKSTPYRYAAQFCEENVWWLGRSLVAEGYAPEQLFVLILTSPSNLTPLFSQQLADPFWPVFWDYHVVLLAFDQDSAPFIYDQDSTLGMPVRLEKYAQLTFPSAERLPSDMHIYVRQIPITKYWRHFSSDRSHMRNKAGEPLAAMPEWPCLCAEPGCEPIELHDYINLNRDLPDGSRWWHYVAWLAEVRSAVEATAFS